MTCTGLVVGAYLVWCHGLDIEAAIQQVHAVKPGAFVASGCKPIAGRIAEQEGVG